MIEALLEQLAATPMSGWRDDLARRSTDWLDPGRHGDLPRWQDAVDAIPHLTPESVHLDRPQVTVAGTPSPDQQQQLKQSLQTLHPWRKGPFRLYDLDLDTEWRSDLKWERVQPHLDDLEGRSVLDVGCGNGYFGWRMLGAGANLVVGIDPTVLFVMQHRAICRLVPDLRNWVLPLGIEDLPEALSGLDTVFSMGVLYHRRSPIEHLDRLFSLLRPGGQLVLETLVVAGEAQQVLVPEGRYARMRNVWFLPSTTLLERWLGRCRFQDVITVDVTPTTTDEQRSTEWMRFESLAQCLDPTDPSLTVEGYPAPRRAVVTARRPRT